MINRFIADLDIELKMRPNNHSNVESAQVLDLSRRRDSVETRKTPSPYNTSSSCETSSPKTNPDHTLAMRLSTSPRTASDSSALSYPAAMYPFSAYYHHSLAEASRGPSISYHQDFSKIQINGIHPSHLERPSRFDFIKTAAVLQQQMAKRITPPQSPEDYTPQIGIVKEEPVPVQPTIVSPNSIISPAAAYSSVPKIDGKVPRPFKAYPRDPVAMAATFTATDALLDVQKAEKYRAFRKRMLEQMHASNGGQPTVTNPKMRRSVVSKTKLDDETANDSCSSNEDQNVTDIASDRSNNNGNIEISQSGVTKDAAYFERRKKNNAAAKKSRDRRRIKEDEIAVRAAFLEHENIELRIELAALKNQVAMLTGNRG